MSRNQVMWFTTVTDSTHTRDPGQNVTSTKASVAVLSLSRVCVCVCVCVCVWVRVYHRRHFHEHSLYEKGCGHTMTDPHPGYRPPTPSTRGACVGMCRHKSGHQRTAGTDALLLNKYDNGAEHTVNPDTTRNTSVRDQGPPWTNSQTIENPISLLLRSVGIFVRCVTEHVN